VSFFTNSSRLDTVDGRRITSHELTTSFALQLPEQDTSGFEYGVDLRYAAYAPSTRPERASIYEGFVGGRMAGGRALVRVGHVWLNDLGSLGSLAGGHFELRQSRSGPDGGRVRAGAFAGLEPNILETGYAPNVKKFGGYIAYDGRGARRHVAGYVAVHNASIAERSVLTTTNFLPVGGKLFIYQAAEVDVQPPAGQGRKGLAYFFATARALPTSRLELQGTYNRGRSVDARGLSEDLLVGRPISTQALEGLLYESVGGRATVEIVPRVRVYGGYSRDKNNRDAEQTGRVIAGGYASNIGGSGVDVTASDSLLERPSGRYHSRYLSIGRSIGRSVYASADYSTSLSVVRFSRSDGITVETRPHTTRYSGTASVNIGRFVSLLANVERTTDDQIRDFRLLSGITLRTR
jgi:hypothetical protein